MDPQPRSTEWRSILLLIFSLTGTIFFFSAGVALLTFTSLNNPIILESNNTRLATILTASTLIALGLLLLPVAWLSWKRLRGPEYEIVSLPAIKPWIWVALPGLWVVSITVATLFYDAPGASIYIPFLHFLAISLPIYLIIRVFINRIPLGSRQRAWGVFSSGLTLSPLLAVIAEGIIIVLGLLALGVYLGFNPEKMFGFERLVNQIEQAADMESLVFIIGPLLKNPLTLVVALAFLSVFVPIIEEIFKSIGVWMVVDRLSTPAQGFALGVLSGAGFALSESLFASVTADDTWAVTISARVISSTMHMLATGLVGWGIAYARLEKRYLRLIGMLFLAILLHGVWNAGAVFSAAGGVGLLLSSSEFDILSSILMLVGIGLIFLLASGMFVALFILNKRLRSPSETPSTRADVEDILHIHPPDEPDSGVG